MQKLMTALCVSFVGEHPSSSILEILCFVAGEWGDAIPAHSRARIHHSEVKILSHIDVMFRTQIHPVPPKYGTLTHTWHNPSSGMTFLESGPHTVTD